MVEEASIEFRLRKTDETRNYLLGEIKHNDLMNEKYNKTCKCLNYVENLLNLLSAITGCVSISAYASLVDINVGITSYSVEINICAVIGRIKKYKPTIKEKRKKQDEIILLGKDKLNTIEVLVSKSLINSYISR